MSRRNETAVVDFLVQSNIITPEQRAEVCGHAEKFGTAIADDLVKSEYVTPTQLCQAVAHCYGLPYFDLTEMTIPPVILEFMPESVARENLVLPLAIHASVLFVVMSDPTDAAVIQKLEFILNRHIQPAIAPREQIIDAINRHYGQTETESVDSYLAEFTDTAIDFTETVYSLPPLVKEDLVADLVPASVAPVKRMVERQMTVRYYSRINPERTFPLLVVLSRKQIEEAVKRNVKQAASNNFAVALDSLVEVEPILPGCSCYPPREQLPIRTEDVSTTFWVVPHVLGKVMQARVVVRQEGKVLAEVPLEMRVVKQGLTLVLGLLSLILPLVLLLLKQFKLDLESQAADGFGLYAQLLQWMVQSLSPEVLGGFLLLAMGTAYLCLRPRKRDVFWDIKSEPSDEVPRETPSTSPVAAVDGAESYFLQADYRKALELYERMIGQGTAQAADYFRASIAAFHLGNHQKSLAILEWACANLPSSHISGAMWYNMACCCARLGRLDEGMRFLNRAVDAGHANPSKYRSDPDLAPLRWRADFKRLLGSLSGC